MKTSVFLIGVVLTSLLAFMCLASVLVYLEPSSSDLMAMSLFYVSLFIGASGTLSLIGFIIRRLSRKPVSSLLANQQLRDSFRQGVFLALILIGALILQSKNLANWKSLSALVGTIGLIEFLAIKK
ncbi:hypothetical protein ACFLZ0_01995 [Patescibacteria group bacterium]